MCCRDQCHLRPATLAHFRQQSGSCGACRALTVLQDDLKGSLSIVCCLHRDCAHVLTKPQRHPYASLKSTYSFISCRPVLTILKAQTVKCCAGSAGTIINANIGSTRRGPRSKAVFGVFWAYTGCVSDTVRA